MQLNNQKLADHFDELNVAKYFHISGLFAEKIPECEIKTPDLDVCYNKNKRNHFGYCEIKAIERTEIKQRNISTKLENHFKSSASKFREYNHEHNCPNIISIINYNGNFCKTDVQRFIGVVRTQPKEFIDPDMKKLINSLNKTDFYDQVDFIIWLQKGYGLKKKKYVISDEQDKYKRTDIYSAFVAVIKNSQFKELLITKTKWIKGECSLYNDIGRPNMAVNG